VTCRDELAAYRLVESHEVCDELAVEGVAIAAELLRRACRGLREPFEPLATVVIHRRQSRAERYARRGSVASTISAALAIFSTIAWPSNSPTTISTSG
jgi:hypothetical protein